MTYRSTSYPEVSAPMWKLGILRGAGVAAGVLVIHAETGVPFGAIISPRGQVSPIAIICTAITQEQSHCSKGVPL